MKIYNLIGYVLIAIAVIAGAIFAPASWGPLLGMSVAFVYLVLVWFLGGLGLHWRNSGCEFVHFSFSLTAQVSMENEKW